MRLSQQNCLIALFALTRPLTLQAEAVAISAEGLLSTTAYLLGMALVTHLLYDCLSFRLFRGRWAGGSVCLPVCSSLLLSLVIWPTKLEERK